MLSQNAASQQVSTQKIKAWKKEAQRTLGLSVLTQQPLEPTILRLAETLPQY